MLNKGENKRMIQYVCPYVMWYLSLLHFSTKVSAIAISFNVGSMFQEFSPK